MMSVEVTSGYQGEGKDRTRYFYAASSRKPRRRKPVGRSLTWSGTMQQIRIMKQVYKTSQFNTPFNIYMPDILQVVSGHSRQVYQFFMKVISYSTNSVMTNILLVLFVKK